MPDKVPGRVVDPQPGWAHPATREQRLRARHLWGVIGLAVFCVVVTCVLALLDRTSEVSTRISGASVGLALAAPFLLLAWYADPNVRQRRYLRKYPWVEYDAQVAGFTTATLRCVVTFTDETGTLRNYKVDPNDDDYERGQRPIWFAGVPGKAAAVISLRQGACTGMAYPSQFVPGRSAPARR